MAESTWRARVLERAAAAEGRSVRALRELSDAAPHLVPPVFAADAQGVRARAQLALSALRDASNDLALAGSSMVAAKHLALCGVAADPMAPLGSIDLIPDGDGSVRLALGLLQFAGELAEDAYEAAERCHVRILKVTHLLGRPGLPGVDSLLDGERAAAHGDLVAAQARAAKSAALAIAAHWLLR